jgi:hypothetical protein
MAGAQVSQHPEVSAIVAMLERLLPSFVFDLEY